MTERSRTPLVIWLTCLVHGLVFLDALWIAYAVSPFVGSASEIRETSVWATPGFWWIAIYLVGCPLAIVLVALRWRLGYWISLIMFTLAIGQSIIQLATSAATGDAIEIMSYITATVIAVGIFGPLLLVLALSRKVKIYFGMAEPLDEASAMRPPPPPTFDV